MAVETVLVIGLHTVLGIGITELEGSRRKVTSSWSSMTNQMP
ncbi:hypothetical protein SETIT_8G176400v2 [Setaria italica]|uniref:Uncharacterized protein n=1 Tax=Setaria italica TaxID=4555 RepID=A0A368S919_SETIT|nr:hypothetical protein SETIT_8G176400v2 [Setaria italica]